MPAASSLGLSGLTYSVDPRLPTDLGDSRIGIDDPRLARVVAALLSRLVADHRDPKAHTVYVLSHALPEYASQREPRSEGSEAPHIEDPIERPLTPLAIHRHLGITFEDLRAELARLDREKGAGATLDVNLLCHYFPPRIWPVVAQMIEDGPAATSEGVERHLHEFAARPVAGHRNREAGLMSVSMIRNRANAFRQLMRWMTELRWSHPDAGVLASWEGLPGMELPEGEDSPLKNTAPPWHAIRHSWWQLNSRIRGRLRVDSWEDEAPRIRTRAARSEGWATSSGLHLLLRDRALLGFVAVVGARRGATAALRRGHYVRGRRLPDGGRSAAIELTPLKTRGGRASRFKPIPTGLAATIEAMIAFAESRLGRPLEDDDPLWFSSFGSKPKAMTPDSLSARFSGTTSGAASLVPYDADNPTLGHSPHTIRAAAAQSVLSFEAQGWLEERRIDAHPISIAEALLDHENMKLDEFGYHGAKKAADREKLSAIGAQINWLRLATPLGARKTHDASAYRALLETRVTLMADRERWGEEKRKLRRKASRQARRKDFEQVVYTNVQADLAADQEADAINRMAEIDGELKELEFNPRRLVLVPDDVPNEAIEAVDLEEIRHEVERLAEQEEAKAKRGRGRRRQGTAASDC